jgi:hypothetical protein
MQLPRRKVTALMISRMKNSKQSSERIEKWPIKTLVQASSNKRSFKESEDDDEHGQSSLNNQAQLLNAPVKENRSSFKQHAHKRPSFLKSDAYQKFMKTARKQGKARESQTHGPTEQNAPEIAETRLPVPRELFPNVSAHPEDEHRRDPLEGYNPAMCRAYVRNPFRTNKTRWIRFQRHLQFYDELSIENQTGIQSEWIQDKFDWMLRQIYQLYGIPPLREHSKPWHQNLFDAIDWIEQLHGPPPSFPQLPDHIDQDKVSDSDDSFSFERTIREREATLPDPCAAIDAADETWRFLHHVMMACGIFNRVSKFFYDMKRVSFGEPGAFYLACTAISRFRSRHYYCLGTLTSRSQGLLVTDQKLHRVTKLVTKPGFSHHEPGDCV